MNSQVTGLLQDHYRQLDLILKHTIALCTGETVVHLEDYIDRAEFRAVVGENIQTFYFDGIPRFKCHIVPQMKLDEESMIFHADWGYKILGEHSNE